MATIQLVDVIKLTSLAAVLLCLAPELAAEPVSLASVELPPYASEQLPGQGVTSSIVRAALKSQGVEVNIGFYPWRRAIALTQHQAGMKVGFFPAYQCDEGFITSVELGLSVTGFAQRTDNPIEWQQLSDLKQYRLGLVAGYVNSAEFDRMVAAGLLETEPANYDKNNIQKLLAGRVDAIVVDRFLFEYLFSSDPDFIGKRSEVQFNSKILNQRSLYVCFDDSQQGRWLAEKLATGLEVIDLQTIVEQYIR